MTKEQNVTESQPEANSQLPEQYRIRAEKRERLISQGVQPYPVEVPITSTIKEIREKYSHLEAGEETGDIVGIAGRVIFSRNTGKLCFATLQDGEGNTLQVMLSAREVGMESLAAYKADVDLGDILFAHGQVISSRRGELSVMAAPSEDVPAWLLAAKALRPLPKVFESPSSAE